MKGKIGLFIFMIMSFLTRGEEITISSATSLKPVVEKLILEYKKTSEKVEVNINYGSSGTLRKQIENGAEIDIVLFADSLNLKKLEEQKLIEDKERNFKILNTLIFVGNKPLEEKGVLALCEPNVVPLGSYSLEALTNIKYKEIYEQLRENTVIVRDFREVINALENENIDYGILYKTELSNLVKSYVLFEIESNTHTQIEYRFGLMKKEEKNPKKESIEFYKFLNSKVSEKIFREFGFKIEKM